MANFVYDKARESFLKAEINITSDNIKVVLCSSGYTANASTDQFLSDISGGNRIATTANLASKTTTAGVFDAADTVWSAVAGGSTGTQAVIYQDTGSAATSRLIANINVATNLPVTSNGSDIDMIWDNGSNKILKL